MGRAAAAGPKGLRNFAPKLRPFVIRRGTKHLLTPEQVAVINCKLFRPEKVLRAAPDDKLHFPYATPPRD
ncbi:MAG: hypothetical protein NVSMB30_18970 [Hymenobacter sp.]